MLDAKANEAMVKRIAEKKSDELQGMFKKAVGDGFMFFSRGKPADRLRSYMAGTAVDELQMILDPEYIEKLRMGQYPPPFQPCNEPVQPLIGQVAYCRQAKGHDDLMQTGIHTPDAPAPFVNFWAMIIELPWWKDWSPWQHFTDDFNRLLVDEVVKLREQAQVRGMM